MSLNLKQRRDSIIATLDDPELTDQEKEMAVLQSLREGCQLYDTKREDLFNSVVEFLFTEGEKMAQTSDKLLVQFDSSKYTLLKGEIDRLKYNG